MRYLLLILSMVLSSIGHAETTRTFLPVEQAFPFTTSTEGNSLVIKFDITEGYYLYHKRFSFKAKTTQLTLAEPQFSSQGLLKDDPNFGQVRVYPQPLTIRIPFDGEGEVSVRFQGCAEDGLCYLPQSKILQLKHNEMPPVNVEDVASKGEAASVLSSVGDTTDSKGLSEVLRNAGKVQALLFFLILGAGLSLTPCVLPMIPILSSIIGGQSTAMTGWQGFKISLAYVLGMATSYALAGVFTATLGQGVNIQAAMQQTWVLALFATVFVLLALAMFGFYELQLPSRFQVALNSQSQRFSGGKEATVFAMGAVSALVVSPCVSAPLAGALLYVSTTQDWLFGGSALFVMALGMGLPLLVIGTSGGRFLPKSGPWMVSIKQLFGVMLLAVAVLLVSRFSNTTVTMGLWALLFIGSAIHFGALEAASPGWQRTRKLLAFLSLIYGVILLVGMFTGADDPFDPLVSVKGPSVQRPVSRQFIKTEKVDEVELEIRTVSGLRQLTVVDLYADWCASCKVMEREVFQDPLVTEKLSGMQLIKLDVTQNTNEQKTWLSEKQLFGPPALLFFDSSGNELKALRLTGEISKQQLISHLERI